MSVPYKNPISSIQVGGPQSISRTSVFGTNFSVNSIGGYMEVYNLSDLTLTLTASTYPDLIQLSANTIPIRYTKGNGTFSSPDYITLNSDNVSSGRRKLGMLVYVHETDLTYQFVIPNYDTLWNNLTGLTGFSAITYSDYTTVVTNHSSAGQSFIQSWTASTIEGVGGYTSANANWRIFQTGSSSGGTTSGEYLPLSGGTVTGATNFTNGLSANTISATTYYNLPPSTFSGGTVTGPTIFTNGLTANTISATTYYNLPTDVFVTGGTYSSGTAIFTNNTGGTFNVTGFSTSTGTSFTGGTVSGATNFTGGLSANTISATTITTPGVTLNNNGLTATTISATTYYNLPSTPFLPLSGGTVSGATNFTNGLTANTISATTYYNLPATPFLPLSGGTVSGATSFTGGLTANTISATTYYNLPTDVFVTGGTYTSGNAIFTNNSGGTFTVTGFPIGSGGGQIFYLNLSQSQNGNRLLSTTASTASEQSTGVTINNGVTGTIASFQSQPLNTTLLPGGIWSFYLHSYKENNNASFDIFVEVYKRTSGGTQTLLFTTDPSPVTTDSPNPSMQLSDGYFSGTPLSVSDSVVAVVRATNTSNQSHTITLFTEGSQHYSYVVSTIPTQQGLTCDTLSGCSIIQTIQTDVSNKLDKSGGTITGNLIINSGLTATTVSATTYQNLPTDVRVTGATYSNNTFIYTNNTGGTFSVFFNTMTGLTATTISATTYQNLPTDIRVTGGTYSSGSLTFTNNTGGTFNVTGLYTGGTDVYVTGGTFNKDTSILTFTNVTGGTFNVTGLTDIFVTGGTYSGSTIIFTNNTGGTFNVTGITTSSSFTGGTVSGATNFTGGLTANTISATTITSPSVKTYGLIVATSLGYQNIF